MGNFAITIIGVGTHHNRLPTDVEQMFDKFVDALRDAGHHVQYAVTTTGAALDHGLDSPMLIKKEGE